MKRKKKKTNIVEVNFATGAFVGAFATIILIIGGFFFKTSGITSFEPMAFAKKGGGGKTQGDYDSSNFNFPEDAGSVLLNTSFEINDDSNTLVPDSWTYHYDQPNRNTGVDCTVAKTGNCSYYVSGKKNSAIKQYIKTSGQAGDVVTISGWGKGLKVGDRNSQNDGVYWVQSWIHYNDGTTQYNVLKKFPNGTYDFMLAEASFAATKPFFGITVFNRFDGSGEAWFDDISLSITPAN